MASPTSHATESRPAWPPHGRERLVGTDLHRVGLSATGLPGESRRRANLREAWLCDACLHAGDLRDADLRGAKLDGADLDGADLRGAKLDGADLRDATFSPLTAWPADFDPVAAGARLARGSPQHPRRRSPQR
jgi:uncharacterized protein YjbI with pentapeptide repeats